MKTSRPAMGRRAKRGSREYALSTSRPAPRIVVKAKEPGRIARAVAAR
jgi:hypothetical protein